MYSSVTVQHGVPYRKSNMDRLFHQDENDRSIKTDVAAAADKNEQKYRKIIENDEKYEIYQEEK